MNQAWRLIAENRIQEAFGNGEFDNLPGKGQPLDLTGYFSTPEHERIGFSMLRNAGVLPPEMELLKEIESLEARFKASRNKVEQERLQREIQVKKLKAAMALEQRRTSRRSRDG